MKKIGLFLAGFLSLAVAHAMTPTYTGYIINSTGLAYSTTSTADLNALQVDQLSFQAVYSSAALPTVNFNDGTLSTGSITVGTNSGYAQQTASDTITIGTTASLAAQKASDSITVSSNTALTGAVLTANGRRLLAGSDWIIGTSTDTAESIKKVLNTVPGFVCSRVNTVVYTTASAAGLIGNTYTLSCSTPALTIATPNFTNGVEQGLTNAILTVNGTAYRNGYSWKSADTSSGTATNIATFLSHLSGMRAVSSSLVVTASATVAGSAGNAFTFASSTPTAMAIGSAHFTNGLDSATVTLNGVVLTYNADWNAGTTSSGTAKAISDAIEANGSLNTIITATWTAGAAITLTALTAGPNYSIGALPTASFTISGGHMTGGAVSGIDTTNDTITAASNGLTLAYGALFSALSASTPPGGLTDQTTYYAIPVDANTFKLATSASNATSRTAIDLTSQGSASGTFRLVPLNISGNASFKFQESNDNSNWNDVSISSVSFLSPFTSTSTYWDLGQVNMHYIRVNYVAPSTGGMALAIKANGKRNP